MTYEAVMQEVQEIFRDITDNPDIHLKPETTAGDIEEWDSLTHIQLVVGIEAHFKINFTAEEIGGLGNIDEMCKSILKKITV